MPPPSNEDAQQDGRSDGGDVASLAEPSAPRFTSTFAKEFMNPNPEDIKSWSLAGSALFSFAREALRMIPDAAKRAEAESSLAKAEGEFKQMEAGSASKLGFELCLRCWPPEIMLMNEDDINVCRGCGSSDNAAYNKKIGSGSTHP